jgi:hypothetical protein
MTAKETFSILRAVLDGKKRMYFTHVGIANIVKKGHGGFVPAENDRVWLMPESGRACPEMVKCSLRNHSSASKVFIQYKYNNKSLEMNVNGPNISGPGRPRLSRFYPRLASSRRLKQSSHPVPDKLAAHEHL